VFSVGKSHFLFTSVFHLLLFLNPSHFILADWYKLYCLLTVQRSTSWTSSIQILLNMMPAESAYLGMVGKNKQVELLFLLLLISA
jgi:hypothetical protein